MVGISSKDPTYSLFIHSFYQEKLKRSKKEFSKKMFTNKFVSLWLFYVFVVFCKESTIVDDENRPYEFGFSIDGQQHRHERRDANGIIQGEFGFITADGIYHVTVYATDENGRFKILSMRNIRISGPLDGSQAGSYTTKPLPIGGSFNASAPAPKPSQVPNVQNVQIANVGAVTERPDTILNIKSSKQPFVFTTQATIKPACAGCGYVTKSSSTTPKSETIPNVLISTTGQIPSTKPDSSLNIGGQIGQPQDQQLSGVQGGIGQNIPGSYQSGGYNQGQNQQSISQIHQSSSSLGTQPFNTQKPLTHQNIPQNVNYPSGGANQGQGGPGLQPSNIQRPTSQTSQNQGVPGLQPSNVQGPTIQNIPQNVNYPSGGANQGQGGQTQGGPGVQPSNIQRPSSPNIPQNPNYPSGGVSQGQDQISPTQGGPGLQFSNIQGPTNQNIPQNVNYPSGGINQGQGGQTQGGPGLIPQSLNYPSTGISQGQVQTSQTQGGLGIQPASIQGPTNQNIPQNVNYPGIAIQGQQQISPPQSGVGQITNVQGHGQNLPQNANYPSGTTTNQGQSQVSKSPSGLGLQPSSVQNQQGITTESGSVQISPNRKPPTEVFSHGTIDQNVQRPIISTDLQGDKDQLKPHSVIDDIKIENNTIFVPNNPPIPIEDKYPGMTDGLPDGITTGDISDLLYKFNYTIGFHGHYEMGWRNGTKVGGYFVNGRDGISRIVTYVADEFGYRPKVRLINLGYDSILTPKEETEKSFGLQSFEFVWYPLK